MATLALAMAGNIILPGAGMAIGAALGSYLDQKFIYPALFKPDDPETGVNDLGKISFTGCEEGTPLPFSMGPYCHVPGIIIWKSANTTAQTEAATGGKGGAGSRPAVPPQVVYYCHLSVLVNDGESTEGNHRSISNIDEIWANGKPIWVDNKTISQSSNEVTMLYGTTNVHFRHPWPNTSNINFFDYNPGYTVDVDGWDNAGNNDTFDIVDISEGGGYRHMTVKNPGTMVYETNPGTKTISFDQEITGWKSNHASAIYQYMGTTSQTLNVNDPYLDWYSDNGNKEARAYRRRAFFTAENLILTNFANQVPRFECFIQADASPFTYADAIEALCDRAGVSGILTTDVDGNLEGYTVYGQSKVTQQLQPIMLAGDILSQENGTYGNYIRFFSRKNADVITIDDDDLGACEFGTEPAELANITDSTQVNIPKNVHVEFQDIHSYLEKKTEPAVDDSMSSGSVQKINLPISMSKAEARAVARRILWMSKVNRQGVKLTLPPKYCYILENDKVQFSAYGEDWQILVKKKERGHNGVIVIEGIVEHDILANLYWEDTESDAALPDSFHGPPLYDFQIIDVGPFHDQHINVPGVYFATGKYTIGSNWDGCYYYESYDNSTFNRVGSQGDYASIGRTTSALGDVSEPLCWDYENTVDIYITEGELESVTKQEVINGANRAAIYTSNGWEIIGFANATFDSTDVNGNNYTLSTLLRGLCNTESVTGDHATDQPFVYLNGPGVYFYPLNTRANGTTRYYKAVPGNGDESDYSSISHTHSCATVRPYAPCHVTGSRDGSNNLTIIWQRRTRAITRMFSAVKPQPEPALAYEVDIYGTSWTSVLRTITATSETATYTAAQQTADGLTPGNAVKMKIYQVSQMIGRGNAESVEL